MLPSLLDVQLPFPLETCLYQFPVVRADAAGRIRALAVAARRTEIAAQLDRCRALDLDPVVLDHEGLALWTQSLVEIPLAPPALRVVAYLGAFRTALAVGGRLNRDLSREYKLREPVWLMELDLETLLEKPLRASVFHSYSKFPAVERDFSLLAPDAVPYGRLEEAIRRLDIPEIQDFRPVELFRGGAVPAGQYSLLLRVTFQSADRTLTSEELNEAGRRLLAALEPLGVRLRS
ncbi:MAG: hypothetical protein NTV49_11445 [Kiritimatiellaeota bacterium]|nr:hypothetical protein [Kiritimatiellota bacterium]